MCVLMFVEFDFFFFLVAHTVTGGLYGIDLGTPSLVSAVLPLYIVTMAITSAETPTEPRRCSYYYCIDRCRIISFYFEFSVCHGKTVSVL